MIINLKHIYILFTSFTLVLINILFQCKCCKCLKTSYKLLTYNEMNAIRMKLIIYIGGYIKLLIFRLMHIFIYTIYTIYRLGYTQKLVKKKGLKININMEPMFSFYKAPITNVNPYREINLENVYQLITGRWLENKTQQLRQINDLSKNREFKSIKFPFVTFSGTFSQRKEDALKEHSGYLVLDFDHIEKPNKLKLQLLKDKHFETELLFVSPNGNGLKWVVSINVTGEYNHGQWFDAISQYINKTYQIEVDKSGRDVSRVCFLCHDMEAFLHPKHGRMIMQFPGEIYLVERLKFNPGKWLNKPKAVVKNNITTPLDKSLTRIQYHVEVVLRRIENHNLDLTCNYQDWLVLGFALANEFGESGRNYFHRVSRFYSGYNFAACDRQFDRCLQGKKSGVTIKSFFAAAKEAGINVRV